ncbi:MAG: T9SS type A sorting domain-containing protein [Bacteroidetes bacterium]|nr:T9SS type A sorting domain-containing protein [Bacteroidota bacterium]
MRKIYTKCFLSFFKSIILLCFSLSLNVPLMLNAQSWQWAKQIGGTGFDAAYISHIDSQHNIYLYGRYAKDLGIPQFIGFNCYLSTDSLIGQNGSFIAKYSENGNLIWVRNIVSPSHYAVLDAMGFDSVSNVFYLSGVYENSCTIAGCGLSSPGYKTFLSKIDTAGNCIWSKNIAIGSNLLCLTFDNHGNVYSAGWAPNGAVVDTITVAAGAFIAKFDSSGNCLWAKTKVSFISFSSMPIFFISQIKFYNNNVYASGSISGSNDTISIDTISKVIPCTNCAGTGIVCMDTSANVKWFRLDGLPYAQGPIGMNNNGDIYLYALGGDTCYFGTDTIKGNGSWSVIVKYDQNGNIYGYHQMNFSTNYSGDVRSIGLNVQSDGTYYITNSFSGTAVFGSYTISAGNAPDLFIARFNDAGDCLGLDHVGGSHGTCIAADGSGVYVTGVFSPFPSDSGMLSIGSSNFSTHGYEDIVFAKHNLLTGTGGESRIANNTLIIYANPNKGSFRLKVPDDFVNERHLLLNIFDDSGKLIRQQQLNMNDEHPKLDIFGEAKGTYHVTLSNSKKIYSGKMIVE